MHIILISSDRALAQAVQSLMEQREKLKLTHLTGIPQNLEVIADRADIMAVDMSQIDDKTSKELLEGCKSKYGYGMSFLAILNQDSLPDIQALLELGFDDYIIAPFEQEDFLARASLALNKGQLTKSLYEEIAKARIIHERSLPKQFPQMRNTAIAAYYQPAEYLGGDYYNVLKVDNGMLCGTFDQHILYMTDVSGHGLDSAMLNSFVTETIKSYLSLKHKPGELISPKRILDYVLKQYHKEDFPQDYFVCVLMLVIDLTIDEISYSSVGFQQAPILKVQENRIEELAGGGLPISNAFDIRLMHYMDQKIKLDSGLTLLISTDGLMEQEKAGQQYFARAKELFHNSSYLSPGEIVEKIADDFNRFVGRQKNTDDVTFLVLQYKD